jgi:hypothetical protein
MKAIAEKSLSTFFLTFLSSANARNVLLPFFHSISTSQHQQESLGAVDAVPTAPFRRFLHFPAENSEETYAEIFNPKKCWAKWEKVLENRLP